MKHQKQGKKRSWSEQMNKIKGKVDACTFCYTVSKHNDSGDACKGNMYFWVTDNLI